MYLTKRLIRIPLKPSNTETLLINTMTGRGFIIPSKHYADRLKPGTAINELLKNANFVFPSQNAEARFWRASLKRVLKLEAAFRPQYQIIVNTACNYDCSYCYLPGTVRAHSKILSEAQLQKIWTAIRKVEKKHRSRPGSTMATIIGGEPLLPGHRNIIRHILEGAKKNQIKLVLVSNGYYLAEFAELLGEYRSVLEIIQITLDGVDKRHSMRRVLKSKPGQDTFKPAIEGIRRCLQKGLRVRIRYNVDDNSDDIKKLERRLIKLKIYPHPLLSLTAANTMDFSSRRRLSMKPAKHIIEHILPVTGVSKTDTAITRITSPPILESLHQLIEFGKAQLTASVCANERVYVFAPDSLIYPCNRYLGQPGRATGSYYPSFKDRFPKNSIRWGGKLMTVDKIQKCKNCSLALLCGSTCPMQSLEKTGTLHQPLCNLTPQQFTRALKQILPRFKKTGFWRPLSDLQAAPEHRP